MDTDKRHESMGRSFCKDIELNILSRLPVKPLFRFKCASKTWCSLIDDNLCHKAMPTTMVGFFLRPVMMLIPKEITMTPELYPTKIFHQAGTIDNSGSEVDTSLSFLSHLGVLRILDSCNGLILFEPKSREPNNHYVCNPATKRCESLPGRIQEHTSLFLAFDPSKSLHYRVLQYEINRDRPKTCREFKIFSSENGGSWGNTQRLELPRGKTRARKMGAYLNGSIYVTESHHIVKINLDEQSVNLINVPRKWNGTCEIIIGATGSGSAISYARLDRGTLEVWQLEEEGDTKWVLKHSSILEYPRARYGDGLEIRAVPTMEALHPYEEAMFLVLYNKVYRYDLRRETMEAVVAELSQNEVCVVEANVHPYMPCWVDKIGRPAAAA